MAGSSISERRSEAYAASWWGAALVGAIFILAGLFVLGDVALATVVSAFLIGILLIVAGISEVFQAFSAQHWRGFTLRLLVGVLYAICGFMLMSDPVRGSVAFTFLFAIALIASGIVRVFQSFRYWNWSGPLLFLSGIIGVAAGAMILAKWPISGLWVLGLLVGIDLIIHGLWWIFLGGSLRQERSPQPT